MKVEDLKVGDRVKYKDKIAYCGTTTIEEVEREGQILEICDKFFQISDEYGQFYNHQLSVKKENIISKLELYGKSYLGGLPKNVYKEIPIL